MAEQGEVSRAKRPDAMQHVERIYEAEYRLKAKRMEAFPEHLETAGLITLTSADTRRSHAHLKKELIRVELAEMPYLQITLLKENDFSIIKPCTVPEPCQKHPCQMVLPNEHTVSSLPITKIHRELAIYALENDTNFIASENALKCLTQWSRAWRVPLSICDTIGPDGNRENVLVLGSEFSVHKEAAPMRTYKAFRHLLEHALKPSLERERIYEAATGQNTDVDSDDKDSCLGTVSGMPLYVTPFKRFGAPKAEQSTSDSEGSLQSPAHLSGQASTSGHTGSKRKISGKAVQVPNVGLRNCTSTDASEADYDEAAYVGNLNISPNVVYVFGSTKAEHGSPAAAIGLSSALIPNASFVPQNAGFVSPVSGMPLYVTPRTHFGAPKAEESTSDSEGSLQSPAHLSGQASTSGHTGSNRKISGKAVQVPNVGLRNCTSTVSGMPLYVTPRTRFGAPKAEESTSDSEGSLQSPAHLSGQASTSGHTGSKRKISGKAVQVPNVGLQNCTSTDTTCGNLPLRSFRKWQFHKEGTADQLEIIVHSSHKGKDISGELLLEPQPDIGADAPSPDAVRRAAMSLMLYTTARLLNVRLHGPTGKVENFEILSAKAFAKRHCGAKRQVIDTILAVFGQLRDLNPGHYVLQHEANHGPRAMLLAPRSMRTRYFDTDQPMEGARVANLSSAAAPMQPSTSGA